MKSIGKILFFVFFILCMFLLKPRQDVVFEAIDMSQYIYEFISMGIPMKKLHPKYNNENQNNDEQLFYSSTVDDSQTVKNKEEIDPRWEALKKLKDN